MEGEVVEMRSQAGVASAAEALRSQEVGPSQETDDVVLTTPPAAVAAVSSPPILAKRQRLGPAGDDGDAAEANTTTASKVRETGPTRVIAL